MSWTLAEWRNGIRWGFKIPWSQDRAGSSPASAIIPLFPCFREKRFFYEPSGCILCFSVYQKKLRLAVFHSITSDDTYLQSNSRYFPRYRIWAKTRPH